MNSPPAGDLPRRRRQDCNGEEQRVRTRGAGHDEIPVHEETAEKGGDAGEDAKNKQDTDDRLAIRYQGAKTRYPRRCQA